MLMTMSIPHGEIKKNQRQARFYSIQRVIDLFGRDLRRLQLLFLSDTNKSSQVK